VRRGELADPLDRPIRSFGEPQALLGAETLDQVVQLVIPAGDPTAVATAGAETAALALDQDDVEVRSPFAQLDRRPEARIAPADDADVRVQRPRERRTGRLLGGDRIFEPPDGAGGLNPGCRLLDRRGGMFSQAPLGEGRMPGDFSVSPQWAKPEPAGSIGLMGDGSRRQSGGGTRLWHPFANMAEVGSEELVLTKGEDVWLWDDRGNRYLDGSASLWYVNIGHGRPEIAAAVARQMADLEAFCVFNEFANWPALELAERLASLAPVEAAKVFLTSGGGEGIETAAKLARLHWKHLEQPERQHILSRANAYHGTHGIGTSIAGIPANRDGYGSLLEDVSQVQHDSVEAMRDAIETLGAENVAAVFVEPVIGAGGVIPPTEGYLEGIEELCRKTGVLFVADSVICGFGRLGTWFGVERWGLQPDMIVFAKGVTSGYLPLGGVIVGGRVAAPFWEGEGAAFRHGPTYSGHPVCCAAALANLDVIEREGILSRGYELEGALLEALEPLAGDELVAEVRGGTGLMAAVELSPELLERGMSSVAFSRIVRDSGVIVRPLVSGVAISPPLTATEDHFHLIAEAIAEGLATVRTSPLGSAEQLA
jgi:adenosylmethionine-8-amino-7-oxononanoate aminotransferase